MLESCVCYEEMMMATHEHFSKKYGEPVWEIARLFPVQGEWTAEEYLARILDY